MPGEVTIPPAHRAALAQLLTLPEATSTALVTALQATSPSLLIGTVARRLAADLGIPVDDMSEILFMLASMYLTSRSGSQADEDFPAVVIDTARELDEFKDVDVEWPRAQKLLSDLLACDRSLGITAKALGVTSEYDKIFARARILTDMRPIFGEKVEEPPAAAVIVHTLRITYHTPQVNNLSSTFYLSLDTKDLHELQAEITRALAKEQTITRTLSGIHLPVLSSEEEDV